MSENEAIELDKMHDLALRPHLQNADTCYETIETLLNPEAALYRKGLCIWMIGRIFQIENKDDYENIFMIILQNSNRILNGVFDVLGATKALASSISTKEASPVYTEMSVHDCKSIFNNASLLIAILNEVLVGNELRHITVLSSSLIFSRMSVKSTREEYHGKSEINRIIVEKTDGLNSKKAPESSKTTSEIKDKSRTYKKQIKTSTPIVRNFTKTIPLEHNFISNKNHGIEAKNVYSKMRKSNKADSPEVIKYKPNKRERKKLLIMETRELLRSAPLVSQKQQRELNLRWDYKHKIQIDESMLESPKTEPEEILESKLLQMIKSNLISLPTPFLSSVRKANSYYEEKIKGAIWKVFALCEKLIYVKIIDTWKNVVLSTLREDEDRRFRREAGARALRAFMVDIDVALYRRNFDSWKRKVEVIATKERGLAVTAIKRAYLRYKGVLRFYAMHTNQIINGSLADIYLAPLRLNINYFISPSIREERRHRWYSIIKLQSVFRMIFFRKVFSFLKRKIILIQCNNRAMTMRERFLEVIQKTIKIQSQWRTSLQCSHFKKDRKKVIKLQTQFKTYKSRVKFMLSLNCIRILQSAFRSFKAKLTVYERKLHIRKEFSAALRIQRVWYTKNGEFSTFLLLSCLREIDKIELQSQERAKEKFRADKAQLIQRFYRESLNIKHNKSALQIQLLYRCYVSKSISDKVKQKKRACLYLQRIFRERYALQNKSATKIELFWIFAKKGRFLCHVEKKLQLLRQRSIVLLQSTVRLFLSKKVFRSLKASYSMNRMVKAYSLLKIRSLTTALYRTHLATIISGRMIILGMESVLARYLIAQGVRSKSAKSFWISIKILSLRNVGKICYDIFELSAVKIQFYCRIHLLKQEKKRKKMSITRQSINPFRTLNSIRNILKACFSMTHVLWNPIEERCGICLKVFMHRIGMLKDVYPILVKHGIVSTEQLYQLSDEHLRAIGITDGDIKINKKEHIRILDSAVIRKTILGLSNYYNPEIPKQYGSTINFDRLGYKKNQYGIEFGVVLKEHRQQVLKDIFLEYYGDRNMSKAENLASKESLLNSPFSILQLRRFFSLHKDPRLSKEKLVDLVNDIRMKPNEVDKYACIWEKGLESSFKVAANSALCRGFIGDIEYTSPSFLNTKLWDYRRVGTCFDLLQFAVERSLCFTNYMPLQKITMRNQTFLLRRHRLSEDIVFAMNKKMSEELYGMIFETFNINSFAQVIQQSYRMHLGRNILCKLRHFRVLDKAKCDYFSDLRTNHVLKTWASIRQIEEAESLKKDQGRQEREKILLIEEELKHVPRFQRNTFPNKVESTINENSKEREELDVVLTYNYVEYISLTKIIAAVRPFLAKLKLNRLKIEKMKTDRLKKSRLEWSVIQHLRIQYINSHKLEETSKTTDYEHEEVYQSRFPVVPLRYGWRRLSQDQLDGFINAQTRKKSVDTRDLLYCFEEEYSVLILQSIWRGVLGRRLFQEYFSQENIYDCVNRSIQLAKRFAWVGFGCEGMSLDLWLARNGIIQCNKFASTRLLHHKKDTRKVKAKRGYDHTNIKSTTTKRNQCTNTKVINVSEKGEIDNKSQKSQNKIYLYDFFAKRNDDIWLQNIGIKEKEDRDFLFTIKNPSTKNDRNFNFINYYSNEYDLRSLQDCIKGSYGTIHKMILNKFKNNPNRVKQMADEITKSRFPITRYQLIRYLSKYEGKPALAQFNINQLIDIRTTDNKKNENQVYNIYRKAIERILIVLRNYNIATLSSKLALKLNEAAKVLQEKKNDHVGNKTDTSQLKDLSEHAAKAALILRKGALQYVLDAWNFCVKIQKHIRRFICSKRFQVQLTQQNQSALKLQALMHSKIAKAYAEKLKKQQKSSWEQLWSDTAKAFYWFNKDTESASWDEPNEPYRPLVADRQTLKLIQAWPFIENTDSNTNDVGKCNVCHFHKATRDCYECASKNTISQFCFSCFITHHNKSKTLRQHNYGIIKDQKPINLVCCMCDKPSTRRCLGMRIEQDCHKRLSKLIKKVENENKEHIDLSMFKDMVVKELKLQMSTQRIMVIFDECSTKKGKKMNASNTLKMFRLLLLNIGKDCDDNYCKDCWEKSHSKGARRRHEWIGYMPNAPVCIECRSRPANLLCLSCNDEFCFTCSKKIHSSGNRRDHTFRKIFETKSSKENRYCSTCATRISTSNCELCHANTCDSCHEFAHKNNCKMWRKVKRLGHEQIRCSICNNLPDSRCKQCGDLYCSSTWAGHPGCFALMHKKGNRVHHTKESYREIIDYFNEIESKNEAMEIRRKHKLKKKHMKEKEHSLRLEQYKRQEFERKQRLKNEALIEFQKMQWNSVELKKKNKYSYFNKDSVAFFNNLRHKLPFQIRKSGFK